MGRGDPRKEEGQSPRAHRSKHTWANQHVDVSNPITAVETAFQASKVTQSRTGLHLPARCCGCWELWEAGAGNILRAFQKGRHWQGLSLRVLQTRHRSPPLDSPSSPSTTLLALGTGSSLHVPGFMVSPSYLSQRGGVSQALSQFPAPSLPLAMLGLRPLP